MRPALPSLANLSTRNVDRHATSRPWAVDPQLRENPPHSQSLQTAPARNAFRSILPCIRGQLDSISTINCVTTSRSSMTWKYSQRPLYSLTGLAQHDPRWRDQSVCAQRDRVPICLWPVHQPGALAWLQHQRAIGLFRTAAVVSLSLIHI